MTAVPSDVAPGPILPAWLRRYALSPAEGWLTLILVALMAATVGLSLDDAAWVLGDPTYGDFLPWVGILAALVSFAGAKAGWPRWIVHLIGAVVAALVLPVLVGAVLLPDGGTPGQLFHATATSVTNAWSDLALLNLAVTREIGHYLLVLGIIVWSVGQFAAYAVFGHRRPLDAVIVVGIVLLANMALTVKDQLGFLVIYTLASLFLLARAHALEEQTAWLRRRIGDATTVRSLYLRGGTVFILIAVVGSLALTASASSAPLAGAWGGVGDKLVELSQSLQRFLPFGGAPRNVGFSFGQTATVTGSWSQQRALALTVHLPPGNTDRYYWRAVTYDKLESGQTWVWTGARTIDRDSGKDVLADQADDPASLGLRTPVTFNVEPATVKGQYAISPLDGATVDQSTKVYVVGASGYFGALQLTDPNRAYTMTALVPDEVDKPGGRTKNRLRAAGQNYPDEIRRLYLPVPSDALGPNSTKLLADIVARAPKDDPYDIAATMESELKKFHYNTNVLGMCPVGQSIVECFATIKQGYCQYYASTMTMLLRQHGIPARMVQGYLPGTRDASGSEQILTTNAHAWTEVYFPGYGWQMFDPTGGGLSRNEAPPEGQIVQPSPSALPTLRSPGGDNEADPTRRPVTGTTTGAGPTQGGPGLMIVVALVLLVGVGALAFVAWQRGPRREVTPDSVWRSISRMAARFGFAPRPTQTVYEYAGTLGDVLPTSRPELETVARAKVEVAYGNRDLGADRLAALRDAQRRLRVNLLRLAFRREERRRRRRR